ncbi:peptidyl-tRNA hydrolase 2, mitochondrial-like [Coccinella septempunctata]|uniref:peptidyl-tRNA hydrolase 2, mitochondrial-like n=1 Tax=Coccinella septempunctata TaxID=41139 RepID=UPI001D06B62E|nr:peptidyl-tRNA hydrolase 2, mitochondrial-like [Coccinella septempunctata]
MMGIVTSTSYLAVFSAGTLVGITSTLTLLKFLPRIRKKGYKQWEKGQEEKFEFEPISANDEYRLILAVRNDLKMQKGKIAAQCGHASVAAYAKVLHERPDLLPLWYRQGGTKIAVKIDSEAELFKLVEEAKKLDVLTSVVRDAGQTQVAPGTRTVIAVGPAPKSILDKITGNLKLL